MNTVYVGTLGSIAKTGELSPVVQGSTESVHTITVKYADDTAYDLTGKTVTGLWYLEPSTVFAITGTITVTDAPNGVFTWDKSAADVGTASVLGVQFVITDDGDGETDATFTTYMTVEARADANAVAGSALVGIAAAIKTWLQSLYDSISGVTGTSEDNVLTFDANGIPQDSGVDIAALGGGTADLDGLSDVTITGTPADNELVAYDSGTGEWINQTSAEAGVAAASHDHDGDYDALGAAATVQGNLDTHEGDTANPHSVTAAQADALPEDAAINAQSGAYELVAGDAGKVIEANGTFTITLPDGLDAGFQCTIVNIGTGTITLSATTTLQSSGAAVTLATQYEGCVVYHRGSNVWLAMGGLE